MSEQQGAADVALETVDLSQPGLIPQTFITIVVDTDYVVSVPEEQVTNGIFMLDNRLDEGSTGAGTYELHTCCSVGDLVGIRAVPVDEEGKLDDKVEITGFEKLSGTDLFGDSGRPQPYPAGNCWLGRVNYRGDEIYTIQIRVVTTEPEQHEKFISWDPSISAS